MENLDSMRWILSALLLTATILKISSQNPLQLWIECLTYQALAPLTKGLSVKKNFITNNLIIGIDAVHHGNITELEFHNFAGFMQTYIAHEFIKYIENINFPLVFSRSTAYGSGRWGFHWTGSNAATWQSMRDSIP